MEAAVIVGAAVIATRMVASASVGASADAPCDIAPASRAGGGMCAGFRLDGVSAFRSRSSVRVCDEAWSASVRWLRLAGGCALALGGAMSISASPPSVSSTSNGVRPASASAPAPSVCRRAVSEVHAARQLTSAMAMRTCRTADGSVPARAVVLARAVRVA